jgi:hypothetical protein
MRVRAMRVKRANKIKEKRDREREMEMAWIQHTISSM